MSGGGGGEGEGLGLSSQGLTLGAIIAVTITRSLTPSP